jgi:hypothetical protein
MRGGVKRVNPEKPLETGMLRKDLKGVETSEGSRGQARGSVAARIGRKRV